MGRLGAGLLGLLRRILPVLLCALSAHAVAYRSFVPQDPTHGYLGFYETVVGGLSAVALGALGLVLGALLLGRPGPLRALADASPPLASATRRMAGLVLASWAVLVAQELLEHRVALGASVPPEARPEAWLLALVTVALAAVLIVVLERSCERFVHAFLTHKPRLFRAPIRPTFPRMPAQRRRRNPLADFIGSRAPPVLAR